jgi:myo-inositol-1(or 4)-monophosphatase
MYNDLIQKIVDLGNQLPSIAGKIADIGEKKQCLTAKDIEIENELSKIILKFEGGHSIYAEELHSNFIKEDNVWVIDPISNTFNFIHGLPHYTIVLSHIHKGVIMFAVVYDPSTKELFTAEKGSGTFLNGQKVSVSKNNDDIALLVGPHLSPKGVYREGTLKILERLSKIGNIRTFGSVGLHYAYVACGRVHGAVTKNKDTFPEFAGKLLVEEAGGKFTDFHGNELEVETHGIIAASPVVYDLIKQEINGLKL